MKKYLLPAFILFFFLPSIAQQGFHMGLSGTFNSTWVLKQNNYGTLAPFQDPVVRASEMAYKYTWGGNFGLVLGDNFTDHWGIQGELQFNFTGQKYDDNFTGPAVLQQGTFGQGGTRVNVQREIKLNYFQIPIMAKYISKGKKVKIFACLGPQIGIRTYADEKVKIASFAYLPDSIAFTPDQKFRSIDFGIAAQAGVDWFVTKRLYFEVGLSSYLGVLDINGAVLKSLGWYSKNDITYQKSYNFRAGLMVGVHYLIPAANWKHNY